MVDLLLICPERDECTKALCISDCPTWNRKKESDIFICSPIFVFIKNLTYFHSESLLLFYLSFDIPHYICWPALTHHHS